MNIDWNKSPKGTTGAMIANFPHSTGGWGHVEFIPSQGLRGDYNEGDDAWTYCDYNRVATWNAEGLPPVGTVCEFAGGTPCPEDPFDKDLKEGMQVTIIAHFKSGDFTLAAFTFDPQNPDRGMVQVEQGNFGCFRPIRTAEQIAAEEREAGIRQLQIDHGVRARDGGRLIAEHLWDMGYRKQESSQ